MEKDDDDIQPIEVENGYWRKIEKIIIHKNFKNVALSWQGFDVALIKLEVKNGENEPEGKSLPVCLPGKGFESYNNQSLLMAGYGRRRIPHCITNLIGPERFQLCGRENTCSKNHRTRSCNLNFLDDIGE